MKLILDDSFTVRNSIPDINFLCDFAINNRSSHSEYVHALSKQLYIPRRTTSDRPIIISPDKGTKRIISIPKSNHIGYSSDWVLYVIDLNKCQFVNIGSRNGSIFSLSQSKYGDGDFRIPSYINMVPRRLLELRADHSGGIIMEKPIDQFTTYRTYENHSIRLWLRFVVYKNCGMDQPIYDDCYIGLEMLGGDPIKFPLYSPSYWFNNYGLDITVDFTRTGCPISDEDLLYWIMLKT